MVVALPPAYHLLRPGADEGGWAMDLRTSSRCTAAMRRRGFWRGWKSTRGRTWRGPPGRREAGQGAPHRADEPFHLKTSFILRGVKRDASARPSLDPRVIKETGLETASGLPQGAPGCAGELPLAGGQRGALHATTAGEGFYRRVKKTGAGGGIDLAGFTQGAGAPHLPGEARPLPQRHRLRAGDEALGHRAGAAGRRRDGGAARLR